MHHFTQHLVFAVYDATYTFEGWIACYFSVIAWSLLGTTAALSWLIRSKRPVIITSAVLLVT